MDRILIYDNLDHIKQNNLDYDKKRKDLKNDHEQLMTEHDNVFLKKIILKKY